jgi:molecular chaperone DnaK
MGKIIGIDLGTTFSAVAQLDETGRAEIVHNLDGENITPSVVSIESENDIWVGTEAKKNLGLNDKNVLERFKREMGTDKKYVTDYGDFSAKDLSALVLTKLKNDTEAKIGEIDSAVVTVPANFPNDARVATLNAAKDAGLNVSHLINEPTAAALYFAKESGENLSGPICVYDLGGGTFDVSIVQLKDNEVEVISTEGIHYLGGTDFDEKLQDFVIKKFKDDKNKNISKKDFNRMDAEELKISLSKREEKTIGVKNTNIKISRQEFEDEISTFIAQTEMMCEKAIEDAKLKASDINQIILAGGSTRMPCVRKSIKKVFGKDPVSFNNPDELVALGAAIYAAYKADPDLLNPMQQSVVEKIKFSDITSKYFGFLALRYVEHTEEHEVSNFVIIEKGEKIPISKTENFFTIYDGQEGVECEVTEANSAETDREFVNVLWTGELELPGGRDKGQKVEVTYSFTDNQEMKCSFLDVASNNITEIGINVGKYGISDVEGEELDIDQFTIE